MNSKQALTTIAIIIGIAAAGVAAILLNIARDEQQHRQYGEIDAAQQDTLAASRKPMDEACLNAIRTKLANPQFTTIVFRNRVAKLNINDRERNSRLRALAARLGLSAAHEVREGNLDYMVGCYVTEPNVVARVELWPDFNVKTSGAYPGED